MNSRLNISLVVFTLLQQIAPAMADVHIKTTKLTFAANEKLVEQQVAEIIAKKIFQKIDVDLNVTKLPPTRANIDNLAQKNDGEIARILPYGEHNSTLIRVEPSYYHLTSTAFCLHPEKIKINSVKDLDKYSVAVIRGVAHSDEATKFHTNTQSVASSVQLYELARNNRVDLIIDTGINGKKTIRDAKFSDIKDCGTFAKYDLYIYLNARSEKYRLPLSKEIQKLKKSGELDKIIRRAEEEALSSRD